MKYFLSIVLLASQITLFYTTPTDGAIRMPDECQNLSFCTSDKDYPQTEVDDLLKNKVVDPGGSDRGAMEMCNHIAINGAPPLELVVYYLHIEELKAEVPPLDKNDLVFVTKLMSYEINLNPNPKFSPELGTRLGEGEDTNEINLCEEVSEEKEIRYIIDEHNNVRVVAQAKDSFMQYFPITRCKSRTPTTEDYLVKHDLGDKLENIQCEENKLDLNFVVLSPDLMSLELARVKDGGVPVGCQCRYID